ncbi:MAG: hypothetical protein E7386_03045 [Ruminococcaceae bacterium]|nr:hypothetical protein [Oscillospiraceae bacterium]
MSSSVPKALFAVGSGVGVLAGFGVGVAVGEGVGVGVEVGAEVSASVVSSVVVAAASGASVVVSRDGFEVPVLTYGLVSLILFVLQEIRQDASNADIRIEGMILRFILHTHLSHIVYDLSKLKTNGLSAVAKSTDPVSIIHIIVLLRMQY